MNIEETFTLDAPPETAHAFLSDVHRVAGCVPGVGDIARRDDGSYEATLQVQMGPIRASFAGELSLTASQDPYRIVANGHGRDRKSGSRAEIAFTGQLEPDGATRTRVVTSADVTIRGRLGQFGTGVIRATATEVIRDFVTCANDLLTAEAGAAGEETTADTPTTRAEDPGAPASSPPRRVSFGLVMRILGSWLRDLATRLVARVRQGRG